MSAPIVSRSATHRGLRTARTLTEAFGPAATYNGLRRESTSARIDRIVGRFCAAVLVVLLVALVAGWLR